MPTKLAEGKTKVVYSTSNLDELILKFKDDITALDGKKHDVIPKKGVINAEVSAEIFRLLEENDIPTHFIELTEPAAMKVRRLEMIPIEVVLRNIAAGHLVKNYPFFKVGDKLKVPLVEFFLKNDALHDPMLSDEHLIVFSLADRKEVEEIMRITREVNVGLDSYVQKLGLKLVDFKLEFGRDSKGILRVGDELNIDSMRLWDKNLQSIDKDIYRKGANLETVAQIYLQSYRLFVGRDLE